MMLIEYQEKKNKKPRGTHSLISSMKGLSIVIDINKFSYFVIFKWYQVAKTKS